MAAAQRSGLSGNSRGKFSLPRTASNQTNVPKNPTEQGKSFSFASLGLTQFAPVKFLSKKISGMSSSSEVPTTIAPVFASPKIPDQSVVSGMVISQSSTMVPNSPPVSEVMVQELVQTSLTAPFGHEPMSQTGISVGSQFSVPPLSSTVEFSAFKARSSEIPS